MTGRTREDRAARSNAPKPANFDALAAAWDEPHAFAVEEAKYRDQVRREGGRWS